MTTLILNGGDTPAERAFTSYVDRVYTPRTTALITALTDQRINVSEWYAAMLVEIDRVTFTAMQLGKGGTQTLSDLDLQAIRQWTAEQHQYLALWRDQLQQRANTRGLLIVAAVAAGGAAVEALTGGISAVGLIARAALYAKTARSLLAVAQTLALGMPILPAYPRDGTTECLGNCVCAWHITKVGPKDWDCRWVLESDEHCPQCARRSHVWQPLHIRNGIIESFDRTGLFL